MHEYIFTLRLLHLLFGVFWAGTAIMQHFFLIPAVRSLGPDGGKMMQAMMRTRNFPIVMLLSGFITVLSGLGLMDSFSGHFRTEWFSTGYGAMLGIGGFSAICALLTGLFVNKPAATAIGKLGAEISAGGGPPTPEQLAEMTRLRTKLEKGASMIAWCMILAVATMGVARYI
ncbi:MAG: hypothetical protein JNL57_11080 [Bacteroidetes bacterium]|nr:hypothetical protein [Bacteroidota bacterium]